MIFDHKPPDEITDEEIEALVEEHYSERQHAEFKATMNLKNDDDRLESLRDISSLANSGGGYLIIGIQDDGKGKAQCYTETKFNSFAIKRSITQLCQDHIIVRIWGLEVRDRTVKGHPLVIVRVPDSDRIPHMIKFQRRTDFWRRYDDGKREMTYAEIKEAFERDSVARRLTNIEQEMTKLRRRETRESELAFLMDQREKQLTPSFSVVENGELLAKVTADNFRSKVGKTPYMRIAATPAHSTRNLVNVDSPPIRAVLTTPPACRLYGWNLGSGDIRHYEVKVFEEGVYRGELSSECLELLRNGHMEFSVLIDEQYCWRQTNEEFNKNPTLYPYAVVEYPVSFLKLYRSITEIAAINDEFIVTLQYVNIRGFRLPAYSPNSRGFLIRSLETSPFAKNGYDYSIKVSHQFDPDRTAFELLRNFYASFGHEAYKIPFFNEESSKFEF